MKKIITPLLFLSFTLLHTSCLKDKCSRTYSMYRPVYRTTEQVRANIKSNAPRDIVSPGKLFVRGNYIFLNEVDRGIHLIDNSNPSTPKNVAFIDIPGNLDIAVKDNTLYADCYNDMVTLDITNPLQVVAKKFTDDAFPFRRYSNGFVADTSLVIIDWNRKDTTVMVSCDGNVPLFWQGCASCMYLASTVPGTDKSSSPFGAGVAGSMARFALVNDYLYTVTDNALNIFNINSPASPQLSSKVQIGWSIETIYPFKDRLFIGGNTGMMIYSINNPLSPTKLGQFFHVMSCDPVIADDKNAYVTLRSGTNCRTVTNQMDVLNIENLSSPQLIKTYPLQNPHGLSKDGSTLFVCDAADGLKIYNASNPSDIKLLKQIKSINPYDVIAFNNIALVVAADGLYQFDYSKLDDIRLLSKINLTN